MATVTKAKRTMPSKVDLLPLRETVFEIQFDPAIPTAGDILPGLLYAQLKTEYPEVVTLPMSNVPRKVRQQNPELVYQASHSLRGASSSILVGDRVVSYATTNYPGWSLFKDKLMTLVNALKSTEQAKQITRFSFKYTNLIEAASSETQLALLNLNVDIVGVPPKERGFHLRTEIDRDNYTTIVQIAPSSTINVNSEQKTISGLLIDIDTIRFDPGSEFLSHPESLLTESHLVAKETFFSLLTPSTIERLKPVW